MGTGAEDMSTTQQPEALRDARWYMVTHDGVATLCEDRRDAEEEAKDADMAWPHSGPHRAVQLVEVADVEAMRAGYAAARLEIDGLRDRVQELGAMLRENRSKRIVELEAQLESIGAGGVEPLRKADHFRDATEMISHAWGCRANAFGKCNMGCTEEHERLAKDALDAARYRWLRDGNGYMPEECGITGGDALDELCDEGVATQAQQGQSHE